MCGYVRTNLEILMFIVSALSGCPCKTAAVADALDLERELRAAECALESFATHLKELYRAYGAFLADGPVAYRPLMTRLGLWQVLVDSGLHARLSLADFDDLLCECNRIDPPPRLIFI